MNKNRDKHLKYFSSDEFQSQFRDVNPILLGKLDAYRAIVGKLIVSPVEGAVARYSGGTSQHDAHTHGWSNAIDVFPRNDAKPESLLEHARRIFTGVGFYPEWRLKGRKRVGLHLDVRLADQAEWAGLPNPKWKPGNEEKRNIYVSLEEGFKRYRELNGG